MPKSVPAVNQNSSATLTIVPKDQSGNPVVPASMSYSITDFDSRTTVRVSTPLVPSVSVAIPLLPADTVILNPGKLVEFRLVLVVANYNASDVFEDVIKVPINNLAYA